MIRGSVREPELPPLPAPEWSSRSSPDPAVVERLSRELSLPSALCSLLAARDLGEPETAKRFLRPRLQDLHPPERLADIGTAVDRILAAIERREAILVHGDYDVDGVCAAALLTLWLRRLGASVVPFVPHRMRDGYDLGPAGLAAASNAGATLLITCDSGVLAHQAVLDARSAGIDVIVTDHHTPGSTLPAAVAVVNPNRSDSGYPEGVLCGAGVAFKLCQALAARVGIADEELWSHLDLVALATVADLVPLTGENRVLVRFGLRYLAHSRKVGLRALLEASGLAEAPELDAGQVGFVLAPRINAAGRMGHAERALRLLLSEDEAEASGLARELNEANRVRREEESETLARALDQLARRFDPERDLGVVLAGEGWHPGVVGIVASRVVERIHRPVVMIALDGEKGRGSGRSIQGVHLVRAIETCAEHLIRFGGHAQAAGLDVRREAVPSFAEAFNRGVAAQLDGRAPRLVHRSDVSLPLVQAGAELYELLQHMGPFGMGNPRPVFRTAGLTVVGTPRVVGKGHLKVRLSDGEGDLDSIGFGLANRIPPASLSNGPLEALYQLKENEYRGVRAVQAALLDLRPAGATAGAAVTLP